MLLEVEECGLHSAASSSYATARDATVLHFGRAGARDSETVLCFVYSTAVTRSTPQNKSIVVEAFRHECQSAPRYRAKNDTNMACKHRKVGCTSPPRVRHGRETDANGHGHRQRLTMACVIMSGTLSTLGTLGTLSTLGILNAVVTTLP